MSDCANASQESTGNAAQELEKQSTLGHVTDRISSSTELLQQHQPNYTALDHGNEKETLFLSSTKASDVPLLNPRTTKNVKLMLTKSLLLSSGVSCFITMIAFAYDVGFSSPALHYLSQNTGKHTYFNRTLYRDIFNVSNPWWCTVTSFTVATNAFWNSFNPFTGPLASCSLARLPLQLIKGLFCLASRTCARLRESIRSLGYQLTHSLYEVFLCIVMLILHKGNTFRSSATQKKVLVQSIRKYIMDSSENKGIRI